MGKQEQEVVVGAMGSLSCMHRGQGGRGRHKEGEAGSGRVLWGAKGLFGCEQSEPS